jgi:glycogen operon protein
MLLAGDEIGRSQRGNNNAYCQDNEASWLDWNLDRGKQELLDFTHRLIEVVHLHHVLRRRGFFHGRKIRGSEVKDLTWFRPDGKEMTEEDWNNPSGHCLGLRLAGDAIAEVDSRGNRILDDTLLILLNAHHQPVRFVLPAHRRKLQWRVVLDTTGPVASRQMRGGEIYALEARSLALLRLPVDGDSDARRDIAARVTRRSHGKPEGRSSGKTPGRHPGDFPPAAS